jgi:glutaconate CoA-transferase subunit A
MREGGLLMSGRKSKVISLTDAVSLIQDGQKVLIGGFIYHNKPMALIRELIKKEIKDLTLIGCLHGSIDMDLLIGIGAIRKLMVPYLGFEHLGLAPCCRRFAEAGQLDIWECDEIHIISAMEAAAANLPCMVTRAGVGSDLLKLNPDLKSFTDPFQGEPLVLVPAIKADIALFHAPKGDPYGNIQHLGSPFADLLAAEATNRGGGKVVVCVDEIIAPEELRQDPRKTTIPHPLVDYVVEIPYGAHPCSCHGLYRVDEAHMKTYISLASKADTFQEYLSRYIYNITSQEEYLERIGGMGKLIELKKNIFMEEYL